MSVYLEPGRPIRAHVAVMDTVVVDAVLKDLAGLVVNLTACSVIVTATDREKSTLYAGEIQSASDGSFRVVVQPDVPGDWRWKRKSRRMRTAEFTRFFSAHCPSRRRARTTAPPHLWSA